MVQRNVRGPSSFMNALRTFSSSMGLKGGNATREALDTRRAMLRFGRKRRSFPS